MKQISFMTEDPIDISVDIDDWSYVDWICNISGELTDICDVLKTAIRMSEGGIKCSK